MTADPVRTPTERRLATALDDVARSHSPAPDFDDVRRRAGSGHARPVSTSGPRPARLALAAAAIALVVGGVVAVTTGDRSSPVETVPPADTPTPTPVPPDDGGADPAPDDLAAESGRDEEPSEILGLWDPLEDLTFALDPADTEVPAGNGLAANVVVTNPAEEPVTVPECFDDAITAAIVEPGGDPPPMVVTCPRGPGTEIPPGTSVAFPVDALVARTRATWFDGFLGALPPGTYDAVVGVPGSPVGDGTPDLRVPVTVTEAICPGLTDELVADSIGLDEVQALSRAETRGRPARVVERDGIPLVVNRDLRCERLNLTVVDDRVIGVDLG